MEASTKARWDPFRDPIVSVKLFMTLYRTSAALVHSPEENLRPLELTLGRLCVLMILRRSSAPTLPSMLGDELGVTRANISGLLNGLEGLDLVCRDFDIQDRRNVLVSLTPKGEEVTDQAWPLLESVMTMELRLLTPEEQITLLLLFASACMPR